MANAARKAQAQKNVSKAAKQVAVTKEGKDVVIPAAEPEAAPAPEITAKTKVRGKSIRNTIQTLVAAGKNTAEITEVLVAEFPGSMAALKPNKHISFYRSKMRKVDPASVPTFIKPTKEATSVTTVTVSAKKGQAAGVKGA